ncbi:MAG: DUF3179 domain-containing protein [Chloroflexota bacterium]
MTTRIASLLFLLLLLACGPAAPADQEEPVDTAALVDIPNAPEIPVVEPIEVSIRSIPDVDTSIASVPLSEVYFDTFRSVDRAVPLTRADDELILRLRDAIPPLYNPVFESASDGDKWLSNQDMVIGYADGGEAYAYPVKIMNYHEIVRHDVNGRPVLSTYCPLCQSGVVYDPIVNGELLIFGNTSALYESDMVMLDHQTGSYWVQVSGEAIVGELTGARMTPLPSQTTTWELWLEQHPNTFVLSRDTGHNRNYDRDPFTSSYAENLNQTGNFAFPVSEAGRDGRLEPGHTVLGIEIGETVRVYPLDAIQDGVVNDEVDETAVIVFVRHNRGSVFNAAVDGRTLTFTMEGTEFRDEQTDSVWGLDGTAVSGELAGTQLEPLPSRSALWFSMIASYPELELVNP